MNFSIDGGSGFGLVKVELNNTEDVRIETGAMVYHTSAIELAGKMNGGGIFSAIGRSIGGGEGFFKTIATAKDNNQTIALAPKSIGDIKELSVGTNNYFLNDGVFLASDTTVDYEVVRQKNIGGALFGGQGGFFVMRTSGQGSMLISSFGSLLEIDLDGSMPITIDNYHVVCWEDTLDYNIHVASGTFGFKTGEGLANTFRGRGKIYIQTRNIQDFARTMGPFVANSGSGGNQDVGGVIGGLFN